MTLAIDRNSSTNKYSHGSALCCVKSLGAIEKAMHIATVLFHSEVDNKFVYEGHRVKVKVTGAEKVEHSFRYGKYSLGKYLHAQHAPTDAL